MKKIGYIFTFLMILLLGMNVQIYASENQKITSIFYYEEQNPIYQNENIVYQTSKKNKKVKAKKSERFNAQNYEEDKNILATNMRDYMVNRENEFTIYGKLTINNELTQSDFDKYIKELVQKATSEELANSSSSGDYLKWSWNTYNVSANYAVFNIDNQNVYYLNLNFNFEYYTTYDQEQIVDTHIKDFISQNIDMKNDTILNKTKKIYDYITQNVKYDYKNLNNNNYTLKYTAYAALEDKTAVCQGYAALLYKMARESGVQDVRMITSSTHAWNIVRIGVLYYNLDSTWDAGKTNYCYFLKGTNNFKEPDHVREAEYSTTIFRKNYPTSSKDYDGKQFNIKECTINNLVNSYAYSANYIVPAITIYYEDYQLIEGRDYSIISEKNLYPGIAKIKINGKNYFTGNVEKTFEILPAKMTGLKATKNYTNQINLKWNKQAQVTGYQLYKYNSKTRQYDKIKTLSASTTSYNVKKLSDGTGYSFKIRAYFDIDGKRLYGEYSNVFDTATIPAKVTISSVKAGSKKLTAKWKKVSAGTGYEIQYSTSSNFKSSKTKTVRVEGRKTVSKTIKKLKGRTKYYVRIRAYKTVNGKRYYGSYSKTKYVRIR